MASAVERNTSARKGFAYPHPLVVGFVRSLALIISRALWFIRFKGVEHLGDVNGRGVIVVANHPTYLDPVWISLPIKRHLRFMAWDEAFEWPLVGPLIRYLGAFPVKHRSGIAKSTIVESLRSLREGSLLIIFPEGEREFADGRMHEFKTGAVHIALNAGVPVLPVSIRGGNRIWPQGQKYPRLFRRVDIIYHPLFQPPPLPENTDLDAHLEVLNDELMKVIASAA